MSAAHDSVNAIRKAYGPPSEGYEDFIKSCKLLSPLMSPTTIPDICIGYKLPNGMPLHEIMMQPYYECQKLAARPTDVLVTSYPKTGTTWTQEICYLILNNLDFHKAKTSTVESRAPFLEIPVNVNGIKEIDQLPNPRLFKTHLPYDLFNENFLKYSKIVYIARNPKDTLVSFYHFMKMIVFTAYAGTMEDYLEMFLKGELLYGPFHEHVLGFWKHRNDGNILFLTYEGLQKDLKGGVREIATFLNKSLTEDQVTQIADHCSFKSMSSNEMANYSTGDGAVIKTPESKGNFMRKGKVGDWKNYFTAEMNQKMDDYVEKYFKGSGLHFEYEI